VSDDVAALRDEVALVQRSLDDARAEHARGELDNDGLAAIERRDVARLADARRRLEAAPASPQAPDPQREPISLGSRRRPRRLLALALACAAAVALVVALAVAQPFAGQGPALHLTPAARVQVLLTSAEFEVAHQHTLRALTLYDAVLRLDPTDPEALAESGWLRYEYGLGIRSVAQERIGEAQLARTIAVAPREAAGHLYYGIVLFQQHHDRAGAIAQLQRAAELPESSVEQSLTAAFLSLFQPRG
jgi:tetratricopeptide (TPR) repeat protein